MSQQINREQYRDETAPAEPVPVRPVVSGGPVISEVRVAPTQQAPQYVVEQTPQYVVEQTPQYVVEQPQYVVEQPQVVVAAPRAEAVRTAWTRHFAPDAVIAAAAGVILLLIGLIAITRGGFDGPMSEPVVEVLGFNHTTTLGIIEIVLGVALLIAGSTASRGGARFFGGVLAVGAFVGAVQAESFRDSLALESGFAWLMVLIGVIVVASSLLLPRFLTRSTTVRNAPY